MSESVESWPVRLGDGGTAQREGHARIAGDELVVELEGGETRAYPLADIAIAVEPYADQARGALIPVRGSVARIAFADPALSKALRAHSEFGRSDARADRLAFKQVALWSAAAIASVAFVIAVVIPIFADRIAAAIPADYERRFGHQVAEQIASSLASDRRADMCERTLGRADLNNLILRLEAAAASPHPIMPRVLRSPEVNAFAMPGGQIAILSGLIDFVETPGELAGVIAHEIAHIERRDPARGMARSIAVGALAGLLFGDAVFFSTLGAMFSTLVGASYSREAEAETDARAFDILRKAGIDPADLGVFFERLGKREGGSNAGAFAYLSTHPPSAERARLAHAAPKPAETRAVMPPDAWAGIKRVCGTKS